MITFTLLTALTILFGGLTLYALFSYAEAKGYDRGMEDAEQIIRETMMLRVTND